MIKDQTYAVVDLETTGTKMDGTNRIIQFSCVLVQNNEIVNTFSTLINPLTDIPDDVQNLTGIHPRDVRNAPLFDDVAGTIYALLQNTIFVAHNIQFDYRFLNMELERVGYPELDLEGIDTVQLSQILYPCLASYRLQDISTALEITHDHPHQADSDAIVTAKLLINLIGRLRQLPDGLLKQLEQMEDALLFETGMLFTNELENRKRSAKPRSENLETIQVGKITLRKPYIFESRDLSQIEFLDKWPQNYEKRPQQIKLIKDVDHQLKNGGKQAFFEAPTGTGKTLGYLLPLASEIRYGRRFLVSTTTNALQNQLIDHEIQRLNKILPFILNVVSLKGSQHYIDLDKFAHTLDQTQNDYTQLVQMRLLVWLSQTKTGDMDELNLTVQQLPLFDEIMHHGINGLNQGSPYYEYDFMRRRAKETEDADLVVTNHAYLIHHAAEFEKTHRTLIIDEAQQLVTTTLQNNNQIMDFDAVKIIADTLLVKMESRISYSFENLIEQGLISRAEYRKILQNIQIIDHEVPEFRNAMKRRFLKAAKVAGIVEIPLSFKKVFGFVKENINQWLKIQHAIDFLHQKNPQLYQKFIELLDEQRLDRQSFSLFKAYFKLCGDLLNALKEWEHLSLENLEDAQSNLLMWLSYPQKQEGAHLRIHFGLMEAKDYLHEKVYPFFDQVLFFSGSHFTSQTYEYFIHQLGANDSIEHFGYQTAFDYAKQSQALIVKDAPDINQVSTKSYAKYLSEKIIQVCSAQNRQTMVLFNSNEILEKVYDFICDDDRMKKWQILAQNVTGSAERLKKHFQVQNTPQLLLATGTFWEGVDLPAEQLETLVITRLPFQAIQSPYNQIRYQRDQREGRNPFNDIALPEAAMRFSQGVGRLIRTQKDRGLVVTLDSRITKRNYGKEFISAFPQGMPLKFIDQEQLLSEITEFFKTIN